VVDQVRAVTIATKEIEAKISDEVWNRQRQWEAKRDAIISASTTVGKAVDAIMKVNGAYTLSRNAPPHENTVWLARRNEAFEEWTKAHDELSRDDLKIYFFTTIATSRIFSEFAISLAQMASHVFKDGGYGNEELSQALRTKRTVVIDTLRVEFGFIPQSSGPSVVQGPAPRVPE
jgi:hypothetical protein